MGNAANGTGVAEAGAPKVARRNAEPKRRSSRRTFPPGGARYFLAAGKSGALELGTEMANEQEALVAALKADATFVIATEWRPKVESGRGAPVIRKEAAAGTT